MSVGSEGAGAYHFLSPAGITITEDDHILVADYDNHCIQVLTTEGQFLSSVRTKGKNSLQFEFPISLLAHPNGQVLV